MAFTLQIPKRLQKEGWKVKIRDKEIREPPHVTILYGTKVWRVDLRTTDGMDREPPMRDLPAEIVELLKKNAKKLKSEWDQMYPNNPVEGK